MPTFFFLFCAIWSPICLPLGVLHSLADIDFICTHWLQRNFPKRKSRIFLMLLVSIAWSFWAERNNRIFRDKCKSIASIAAKGFHTFSDWSILYKPGHLGDFAAVWSLIKNVIFLQTASAPTSSVAMVSACRSIHLLSAFCFSLVSLSSSFCFFFPLMLCCCF